MSDGARNSDFSTDGIIYTSKHLHVATPPPLRSGKRKADTLDSTPEIIDCDRVSRCAFTDEQRLQFYTNGYCVINDAIEPLLLEGCRLYIDQCWSSWMAEAKRPDDWRFHFMVDIDESKHDRSTDPILALLQNSAVLKDHVTALIGDIGGIFYTQVAIRTPIVQIKPSKEVMLQPTASKPLSKTQLKKLKNREKFMKNSSGNANCVTYETMRARLDYHIDGQANQTGSRFPDYWTVLVGIALNDQIFDNSGNFTVYPGSHTARSWHDYPSMKLLSGKKSVTGSTIGCSSNEVGGCEVVSTECVVTKGGSNDRTANRDSKEVVTASKGCSCRGCTVGPVHVLPDVGPPTELKLRAGDVVMAHVLLAHKGGRNVAGGNLSTNSTERSDIDKYIDNIPRGSREMVFFRVRKKGLNYVDPARSARVLNEPWCEFGPLVERLRRVSLLNTY